MFANVSLVHWTSVYALPSSTVPSSGFPYSDLQHYFPPDPLTSGTNSPTATDDKFLLNQPLNVNPSTSSLSSALDEDLSRPCKIGGRDMSPQCYNFLPLPLPRSIRINHSCKVSPLHDVIQFRWKSQLGVPLDSLLAETRQIDHWYTRLSSPTGARSLMHISWEGYPPARYCVAVRGRLLRFTIQSLGKSVAENIQHYIATNRIQWPLKKFVLVAFGRGSCGDDWVAVVDKIP